jgi:hypothetical protein
MHLWGWLRTRDLRSTLPCLQQMDWFYIGIDVIRSCQLAGVNVTQLTGIREVDRLNDARLPKSSNGPGPDSGAVDFGLRPVL